MEALSNHYTQEEFVSKWGQICYFVIAVGLGEDAVGKTEQEADPTSL